MKKTLLLNASLLKESDCMYKTHLIHDRGLVNKEPAFQMIYGTAGHKFIATYLSNGVIKDAAKLAYNYYIDKFPNIPTNDFRTVEHLVETCKAYAATYPRATDTLEPLTINNKLCVELHFCLPLHALIDTAKYDHILQFLAQNDIEVLILGTVDRLCQIKNIISQIIVDIKFTSVWKQDEYLAAYALNNQLKFYSWMARKSELSRFWLPAMIDAIFLKDPTYKRKDKVTGKMVPVDGWTGAIFRRSSVIEFSDEKMENFEIFLMNKIYEYARCYAKSEFPENNNQCETKYGLCMFHTLCKSDRNKRDDIMNFVYNTRTYDPAEFQT